MTKAEMLIIRRRRTTTNQKEQAKVLGILHHIYRGYEEGTVTCPMVLRPPTLTEHERYFLKRRREGLTQNEVAQQIGCSRFWLNRMENGDRPVTRLREYWNES